MNKNILYHGSRIPNIDVLKPNPNYAVNDDSVVFATPDIRLALAMIYGRGEKLSIGYHTNTHTKKRQMYVNEAEPNTLHLLDAPGYIYEVDSIGFRGNDGLMDEELIKYSHTEIIAVTKIENILEELLSHNVSIAEYNNTHIGNTVPVGY